MTRLVRLVLGLVGLVVIIAFAVANRTPADVSFAPFPVVLELPVYGVFLFGLVLGGVLGGCAAWLGGHGHRRDARRMRNKVWALENQVAKLQKQDPSGPADAHRAGGRMVTQGGPS